MYPLQETLLFLKIKSIYFRYPYISNEIYVENISTCAVMVILKQMVES